MSEETEETFDMSLLDPNYDPSPEPEPEPEPAADEVVDEVAEDTELPADEPPQSDPNTKADLMDKELQQIQQLRATLAREVGKLQQQGERPTEKQVERVEKAQSKLDKYLNAQDVDPYEGVTDIAEEVLANRSRAEEALQNYEGKIRALEEREAEREAQIARLQFHADYPDLRGQYDALAQKTQDALEQEYGDTLGEMSQHVFVKIANKEFMRQVKEALPEKDEAKTEEPLADSSKKPKAARPKPTKSGGTVKSPQDSEARGEALISQLHQEYLGGN